MNSTRAISVFPPKPLQDTLTQASVMHTCMVEALSQFQGDFQTWSHMDGGCVLFHRDFRILIRRLKSAEASLTPQQKLDLAIYFYSAAWLKMKITYNENTCKVLPVLGENIFHDSLQVRTEQSSIINFVYFNFNKLNPKIKHLRMHEYRLLFTDTVDYIKTLANTDQVLRLKSRCFFVLNHSIDGHVETEREFHFNTIMALNEIKIKNECDKLYLSSVREKLYLTYFPDSEVPAEEKVAAAMSYLKLPLFFQDTSKLTDLYLFLARTYLQQRTLHSNTELYETLYTALYHINDYVAGAIFQKSGSSKELVSIVVDKICAIYQALGRIDAPPVEEVKEEKNDDDIDDGLPATLTSSYLYDVCASLFTFDEQALTQKFTPEFINQLTHKVLRQNTYRMLVYHYYQEPKLESSFELQWRRVLQSIRDFSLILHNLAMRENSDLLLDYADEEEDLDPIPFLKVAPLFQDFLQGDLVYEIPTALIRVTERLAFLNDQIALCDLKVTQIQEGLDRQRRLPYLFPMPCRERTKRKLESDNTKSCRFKSSSIE